MTFYHETNQTMKANELMVGDYVYNHRNWECPIIEIHKNSAVVIAKHYGEEEFLLSDLRPIPLTPEILEKNGFERKTTYQYTYRDNFCKVCVSFAPRMEIDGIDLGEPPVHISIEGALLDIYMDISSIHQLQHALRLCGIEKEIIF